MAKNKKSDEQEKQETSLLPRDWLYNPVVYSQISGDFTLLQQRILAGVLEEMQDKILRSINDKEDGCLFPSLFSEEEMMGDSTTIEISPKKFGINPEHYDYLEEAMKDLANKRIGFPKAYKDKMNYVVAPLFARLELPMGERRRVGKVKVVMLNENIRDFLSMDKGYTEYLSRITQISKKVRTPRIYTFLASFKDAGHKKVDYKDFCKFLGIDDETARSDRLNRINEQLKNKEINQKEANERLEALTKWENPFRKWNKVQSQILDPAKMELDTFSDRDQIDITFDYEALYEDGRKRGNPSHIRFTIVKKRLAIEHDAEKRVSRQRHLLVRTMCDWCKDFKPYDLRELVAMVRDEDVDDFVNFCLCDIRDKVERKQPDNVAAYATAIMENYIKELNRKRDIKLTDQLQPMDLFKKTEAELITGGAADKWQELISTVGEPAGSLLRKVRFNGLRNGQFYVTISKEDAQAWRNTDMNTAYDTARRLLDLPKLAPAIVMDLTE